MVYFLRDSDCRIVKDTKFDTEKYKHLKVILKFKT